MGVAGIKYRAFGPYKMLMQVDGVWIHQAVVVTLDKRFRQRLVLGSNVFESCRLRTVILERDEMQGHSADVRRLISQCQQASVEPNVLDPDSRII